MPGGVLAAKLLATMDISIFGARFKTSPSENGRKRQFEKAKLDSKIWRMRHRF
jgi:hypothetical protein